MTQTFQEAVEEFVSRSRDLLNRESPEDFPPPGAVGESRDGSVPSILLLSQDLIRRYAYTMGDDNPLYTEPQYAEQSPAGSQIAPGTILVHVRYPADHGAQRPEGYPVANFLSGVCWEFYDHLRPGMRFSSSKIPRELTVGRSSQGMLISLHSETFYWEGARRLKAKAYGRLIQVPVEQMGVTRRIPVDRLGERMFYRKAPHRYTKSEIENLLAALAGNARRSADPCWWEDVVPGEDLPSLALPPYSIRDEMTYQSLHLGLHGDYEGGRLVRAFRPAYRRCREVPDFARTHPVTNWPYTPYDEHEDRYLCAYRCQPLPFDFGIQRAQMPLRLLTDWAGDAAFVRRMYTSMRRPIFYGDAAVFHGRVLRKYIAEEGDDAGKNVRYSAVAIEISGTDQVGATHCLGYATVYLPSRAAGLPKLPVPVLSTPGYAPFNVHRRADHY